MTTTPARPDDQPSARTQFAFAGAVALVVLNLYATQALVGPISAEFGVAPARTGVVTAAALVGYAAGLFAIVPAADILENRRLALWCLGCNVVALAGCAMAPSYPILVGAAFAAGASSSAIQILVPLIASLASEARRGRVVGNVMSGLMIGILLSRPIASLVAGWIGWRSFYVIAAVASGLAIAFLAVGAPARRPTTQTTWWNLIKSLWQIVRDEPVLRNAALRQSLCMIAFNIFWTSVALRLADAPFHLGATGIALFALAGASAVIAAPLAGRLGDRGLERRTTITAALGIGIAASLASVAGANGMVSEGIGRVGSLALMVGAAILLDFSVITDQALGRRAINLLHPDARGRTNGLYTGLFFLGSAFGASISGVALAWGGWLLSSLVAAAFGVGALCVAVFGGRAARSSN